MSESKALTQQDDLGRMLEQVVIIGDLAGLSPTQRADYYGKVCQSIGVNPLTRPFEYIELNGKLTLYARRDCTDQLRRQHQINVNIIDRQTIEDVYVVTARATMPDGRTDESTGAVAIAKEEGEWKTAESGKRYFRPSGTYAKLHGDDLANALMKAETKSKRRVTLSIVGLGWLDETEIETIADAKPAQIEPAQPEPTPAYVSTLPPGPPSFDREGFTSYLITNMAQAEDGVQLRALWVEAQRHFRKLGEDQQRALSDAKESRKKELIALEAKRVAAETAVEQPTF